MEGLTRMVEGVIRGVIGDGEAETGLAVEVEVGAEGDGEIVGEGDMVGEEGCEGVLEVASGVGIRIEVGTDVGRMGLGPGIAEGEPRGERTISGVGVGTTGHVFPNTTTPPGLNYRKEVR